MAMEGMDSQAPPPCESDRQSVLQLPKQSGIATA